MTLSNRNHTAMLLSSLFLFASAAADATATLPLEAKNPSEKADANTTDGTPDITTNDDGALITPDRPYAPGRRESKLDQNNDKGFWAIVDIKKNIHPDWLFLFHTEQRWGSDCELYWYQQYDVTFLYNLTEKFKETGCFNFDVFQNFYIGGGAAQISQIKRDTRGKFKWVWLTRPELEMHLILGYEGWILEQRLRGQYSYHHTVHYKNTGAARYRVILTTPPSCRCFGTTAYVSNEIFLRANTYFKKTNPEGMVGGLFQNRLRVGFNIPLIENKLDAKIWWQWRVLKQNSTASRSYNNTYQFGGTLDMSF